MAATTLNSQVGRHVIGDMVVRFYNVTGASGSTLATGLINIYFASVQLPTSITGLANLSDGTLTITGTQSADTIMVIGREG